MQMPSLPRGSLCCQLWGDVVSEEVWSPQPKALVWFLPWEMEILGELSSLAEEFEMHFNGFDIDALTT